MNNQQNPVLPEDPREAEPGRGAPGNNHYGDSKIKFYSPNSLIILNNPLKQQIHG